MQFIKNIRNKFYHSLRWSEKYTHTDMVYLAKSSSWFNLGALFNNGLVFLLAVAFANLLPKEVYGTYRYIISFISILLIANLPGIKGAAVRAVSQGYEKIILDGFKARIKWGLFSSLASLSLGLYYLLQDNSLLAGAFFVAAIFLPFFQSGNIYSSYLLGKKNFRANAKYSIIAISFYTLSMLGAILLTDNVLLIVLVYFAGYTIINTSLLSIVLKKFKPNQKKDPQAIPFGKHLSLMDAINTIASYIDRVLLFHFVGAAEMAVYSFAIALPEQLKGFFSFVQALAFPKWSQASSREIKISVKRKIFQSLLIFIPLIIIYWLLAPLIYKTFFPQYEKSVFFSQIYILGFLNVVPVFVITGLRAKARVKELYQFNILNPVLQIILIVFMAVQYGILGVVIARVSARLLSSFIALALYKKI